MAFSVCMLIALFTGHALATDTNMIGSSSIGQRCSANIETEVSRCLQPLLDYANDLQSDTVTVQFPVQGEGIFERLCKLYHEFTDCVGDWSADCDSMSVRAIRASYGYMCEDGYHLFKQHVHCFAEVELNAQYLQCKREATAGIAALKLSKDQPAHYLNQLCQIMDRYLTCSRPIIDANCGPKAWALVARVTEDSLRVTMPNCNVRPALI